MAEFLCAAFVFLAFITLIGHGIWVLLAAVFRALGGAEAATRTVRCPVCSATPYRAAARCPVCGFDAVAAAKKASGGELAAVKRQLDRMAEAEVISQDQWSRLTQLVRNEEQRLEMGGAGRPFEPPPKAPPVPKRAEQPLDIRWEPAPSAKARPQPEPVRTPLPAEPTLPPAPVAASPVAPTAPAPPRRTLADLLQAFMEERNIRWGEIISGLLIVISSVGLVISLWSTLTEAIPYFPALLFMLITLAIHCAGLYTLRRWKLQSTSRGLLVISTLLVPLNFLAAIALSEYEPQPRGVGDPWYIAAVTVGLIGYGGINYSAARTMLRRPWWPLFAGVMGPAAAQLILSRMTVPGLATWTLNLLALLPLAPFLAAAGGQLAVAAAGRRLSQPRAARTFLLLGMATFSLVVALALLVWKSGAIVATLAAISPGLNLAAVMLTALGVVVHQRVTQPELAAARMAGTVTALLGMLVVLAALGLAWPQPDLLLAIGVMDFLALSGLALLAGMPALHAGAVAALGLVIVLALHLVQGTVSLAAPPTGRELLTVLLMGRSGLALLIQAGVTVLAAREFRRRGRRDDAAIFSWSAAGLASVSALIACHAGFWSGRDGDLATVILAACGSVALMNAARARHAGVTWLGAGLALLALFHGLTQNDVLLGWLEQFSLSPRRPVVVALLLHATWMAAAAAWFHRRQAAAGGSDAGERFRQAVLLPLSAAAIITSLLVLPATLFVRGERFVEHAVYALWTAIAWGTIAVLWRSRGLFAAAQAFSTCGVSFLVSAVCVRMPWWQGRYYDPRYVQAQLAGWTAWSLVWLGVRRLPVAWLRRLTRPFAPRITFDRVLLGLALRGLVALAIAGVVPGVAAELGRAGAVPLRSHASPESTMVWLAIELLAAAAAGTAVWAAFQRRTSAGVLGGLVLTTLVVAALVLGASPWTGRGLHIHAYGAGSWIAWGLILVGIVLSLREGIGSSRLAGLLLTLLIVPLLAAGRFEPESAAASALRWGLAVYGLLVGVGVLFRGPLAAGARRCGFRWNAARSIECLQVTRGLGTGVAILPVLGLTLWFLFTEFAARPALGPAAASLFGRWGPLASYTVPVLLLAAMCMAQALRDRLASFAVAGSLLLQLAVCVLFAVPRWTVGEALSPSDLARLIVIAGLVLSLYSLCWLAIVGRIFNPSALPQYSASGSPVQDRAAAAGGRIENPSYDPVLAKFHARGWWNQRLAPVPPALSWFPSPLEWHVMGTTALVSIPPIWTAAAVIAFPERIPSLIPVFGSLSAYLGLLFCAAAHVWSGRNARLAAPRWLVRVLPVVLVVLLSATLARWSTAENWLAFRALTSGMCLLAATGTILACRAARPTGAPRTMAEDALVSWSVLLGAAALALALRALPAEPLRPWWTVGWTAALAACAGGLALRLRRQDFAYTSVLLTMLATACAWSTPWLGRAGPASPQSVVELLEAVLIAAAVGGMVWLTVDLVWQRRRGSAFELQSTLPPVQHVVVRLGTAAFALLALVCLAVQTDAISLGRPSAVDVSQAGGWGVCACLALLAAGTLWDRTARGSVVGRIFNPSALPRDAELEPSPQEGAVSTGGRIENPSYDSVLATLYVLGLVALVLVINSLRDPPRMLWFHAGLAAAGYALFTGVLSTQAAAWRRLSARLAMAPAPRQSSDDWLIAANLTLAAFVTVVALRVVLLYPELPLRLWATLGAALLVPAVWCLARGARRTTFATLALVCGAPAAVDLGWAMMAFDTDRYYWLQRSIRLMESLAVVTFVYGVVLARVARPRETLARAARNAATIVGASALAALLAVLVLEGVWFDKDAGAPVTGPQIAVVTVVLAGLSAALISLAALPGRDPLHLSLQGRMIYVYAAELVASLVFVHIRLTMPELFRGYLLKHWPFIVMAIAFAGVSVGEWFSRKNFRVLAEPLRRTGAFLPLLPAIGYWIHIEQAGPGALVGSYSTVLFFGGIVYIVLSMWRRSFLYGALAGLAGNGALWALLSEQGIELLAHPQMWLIPPAVCVLAAAQINRDRLSEAQLTAIRYLSVTVIYVSSTGEMFLQGIGEHLWLPIVLALLSLCGVFAGIVLHVRAFLYLGTSFLLLALVSMVWHAARSIGHVWPWWAFGIATGLAILALFGVFEKKRNEVLALMRGLREWEG